MRIRNASKKMQNTIDNTKRNHKQKHERKHKTMMRIINGWKRIRKNEDNKSADMIGVLEHTVSAKNRTQKTKPTRLKQNMCVSEFEKYEPRN